VKRRTWLVKKAQASEGQRQSGNYFLEALLSKSMSKFVSSLKKKRLFGFRFCATLKGHLCQVKNELRRDDKKKNVSKAQAFYHWRSRLSTEAENYQPVSLGDWAQILAALTALVGQVVQVNVFFIVLVQRDAPYLSLPPPIAYLPQI
jgi:uncharacterized membrane protein